MIIILCNFFSLQSHPGGLLFTKFGSNQTALLDLAFPVMCILQKHHGFLFFLNVVQAYFECGLFCVEKGSFAVFFLWQCFLSVLIFFFFEVFIYEKDVLLLLIFSCFFMHRHLWRHFHKFNLDFYALKYLLTDYHCSSFSSCFFVYSNICPRLCYVFL